MSDEWVTVTLPITVQALGTILFIVGVGLLSVLVFFMSQREYGEDWPKQLQKKLGLNAVHPAAFTILGMLWCLLFLAFTFGVFWTLYGIALRIHVTDPDSAIDLRWYLLTLTAVMAALGAVISLPFTLIRVALNRRQTETAEQGHITDRINKAVEGLGAEKTVRRQRRRQSGKLAYAKGEDGKPDYSRPIMEEVTQLNLEVRIGAIYGLERISQDSERDHIQIMEILCAYIRQNAGRENVPLPEDDMMPEQWQNWGRAGRDHLRLDIDVALRVIERRKSDRKRLEKDKGYRLGLERTLLRKIILKDRNLSGADFGEAELQGADLSNANLQQVNLWHSELQGANLSGAELQGANLEYADLRGSYLISAALQGADLGHAQLQSATLNNAKLQGANLSFAELPGATLTGANLRGADLREVDLRGADLEKADLRMANLGEAILSANTKFMGADFRGAALRYVDFTNLPFVMTHLDEMFGDSSVILPNGVRSDGKDWPKHWSKLNMEPEQFDDEWRKWLDDPEGYVPPDENE